MCFLSMAPTHNQRQYYHYIQYLRPSGRYIPKYAQQWRQGGFTGDCKKELTAAKAIRRHVAIRPKYIKSTNSKLPHAMIEVSKMS